MPIDDLLVTKQNMKPITKERLFFINEGGTYKSKTVPIGTDTISYDVLKDFASGWIAGKLFERLQRMFTTLGRPLTPEVVEKKQAASIPADIYPVNPVVASRRGRPRKVKGVNTNGR